MKYNSSPIMMDFSQPIERETSQPVQVIGMGLGIAIGFIIVGLTLASVAYPPYSVIAVLVVVPALYVLLTRPDIAFALFFAVETLFSEDIMLVTEELKITLYRIPLPYIGLNCFEVVLLLLIGTTLLQRKGVIRGTRLDTSLFLFGIACGMGYVTCVLSYQDPMRLFEPRRLLHFFAAYYLTVNCIRSKASLRVFLTIFFSAVVIKALQGVYLYTGGAGLMIKWKIRAIFTGWGDSLCFMTFLLMMGTFWIERISIPWKKGFLLFIPVVIFSLLFSYKRAYYLAMITGTATLFWVQGGKARFRMLATLVMGILVMMLIITVQDQWQAFGMRFGSIFHPTKESSAHYRLVEWQNAFISIRNHPVMGLGLGGILPMKIWLSRTNLLGVHNTFLWVTVKMGVLGLFTYLLIHFTFLQQLICQNSRLHDAYLRAVSHGITCAFIGFTTAQMFAPMFSQMRTATWFGILLGLGMMVREIDRKKSPLALPQRDLADSILQDTSSRQDACRSRLP